MQPDGAFERVARRQRSANCVSYVAIDDDVVEAAMNDPDRALRARDAIHLATARIFAPELDCLVTYDERLVKAASDAGLQTLSPGVQVA